MMLFLGNEDSFKWATIIMIIALANVIITCAILLFVFSTNSKSKELEP